MARMARREHSGWRVLALSSALACASLALPGASPAMGAVPESVTIPLKVVTIPGVGIKVGIEVGLGGGPTRLYTFDTGSSGMYAAYDAAGWPALQPVPGPTIPQSYGSGLQLTADRVSTLVTIPTEQGPISYTAEVGRITQASGNADGEQWLASVAAGRPPLYGMFYGDFGSGLTKPEAGLFAVLPQLPGNLSSGFSVQLGCGGGGPESRVVVGLTEAIRSRVTSWVPMAKGPNSPPFPSSGRPTFAQAVLDGSFTLERAGTAFSFDLPAILDTGGGTTDIHQHTAAQKADAFVIPDAFLAQPGQPSSQILPGTMFRVTAAGTTPSNGFDMSYQTGNTPSIDQVRTSTPDDKRAEVNLALNPFFRYDVVFDVERGNVGFAPCTASTVVGPPAATVPPAPTAAPAAPTATEAPTAPAAVDATAPPAATAAPTTTVPPTAAAPVDAPAAPGPALLLWAAMLAAGLALLGAVVVRKRRPRAG
jgi:hypothetical protein